MTLELSPDVNFTFEEGPSYILVTLLASILIYIIVLTGWSINSIRIRDFPRNALHHAVSILIVFKLFIQFLGFTIIFLVETEDAPIYGLQIFDFSNLALNAIFYITLTLISRGWCVTKESAMLTPVDRQLVFLVAFGMTITDIVASGYSSKIAGVCRDDVSLILQGSPDFYICSFFQNHGHVFGYADQRITDRD